MSEPRIIENDETLRYSEEIINQYLSKNDINVIHNDENMLKDADIDFVKNNNKSFGKLLNIYVDNTDRNLKDKIFFKEIFFYVCIVILFGIFMLLYSVTCYCLKNQVGTDTLIVVMINSILSFIASFIVLPHTIASYLFNTDEEKYMTELVKNIQEHDQVVRNNIKND